MAEWCEHDDHIIHVEMHGQQVAVHVKMSWFCTKEQLDKKWVRAHTRQTHTPDAAAIAILFDAAPYKWRATVFGNHNFWPDVPALTEYQAGEGEILLLHQD